MISQLIAAALLALAVILPALLITRGAGTRCASCGHTPVPYRGTLCRTCRENDRGPHPSRARPTRRHNPPVITYRCQCGQPLQARPLTGVWPRACPQCGLARPKPRTYHNSRRN